MTFGVNSRTEKIRLVLQLKEDGEEYPTLRDNFRSSDGENITRNNVILTIGSMNRSRSDANEIVSAARLMMAIQRGLTVYPLAQ